MGIRIVDGLVYVVSCRDRIVRLHDLDGDGESRFLQNFNGDCPVTKFYHEFAMDLTTDREGNFYYNMYQTSAKRPTRARMCAQSQPMADAVDPLLYRNARSEWHGWGDGYPLLNSDNQGNWMPVDRINQPQGGGFYGFMGLAHKDPKPATYDLPLIWTH